MAAETSKKVGLPEGERASVARRIARDVVRCDPAILGLLIMDKDDGSKILAVERSPSLPDEERATEEQVKRFGIAAMVVWGAADNASQLMGRKEFVVGAFKQQMVLIAGLQEYGLLLAARLTRSANAEHVYSKVASFLGMG
ncbi:MAG TPA: hypothetical protein VLX56_03850 [Nitrososphaerales archaeon]|nr:hypothetical protein [Nitrososphaerales archaeon]